MSSHQPSRSYRDPQKHRNDVPGCLHFSYEDLKSATDNFNQKPLNMGGRKLGEGGFGPVFLGKLCFTEVAIKILRNVPKVSAWIVYAVSELQP